MFLVVPVTLHAMKERSRVEVGKLAAARRRELKMDQAELVRRTKLDQKTISAFERGDRWPRDRSRTRIESALEWTPGALTRLLAGEQMPVLVDREYLGLPPLTGAAPDEPVVEPVEKPWASVLHPDIDYDGLADQAKVIEPIGDRLLSRLLKREDLTSQAKAELALELTQMASDLADALFSEVQEHPELRPRYAESYTAAMVAVRRFITVYDDLVPADERIGDRLARSMKAAYGFPPTDSPDSALASASDDSAQPGVDHTKVWPSREPGWTPNPLEPAGVGDDEDGRQSN
jgi:transcriptional regulator with XRE-family HTH domain